jgi:hypothetical protein
MGPPDGQRGKQKRVNEEGQEGKRFIFEKAVFEVKRM